MIEKLKLMVQIIFALMASLLYLGIANFEQPWKIITWPYLILFIIFIIILPIYYIYKFSIDIKDEKKDKSYTIFEYIFPLLVLIVIYFYQQEIVNVPLYGESKIYNPFSLLGLNNQFVGTQQHPHTWYTDVYSKIITTISTGIFIFGMSLFTKGMFNIDKTTGKAITIALAVRTLAKAVFGYVPKNKNLEQNWFNEYMQYRVAGDNFISRMAALFRRYAVMGIDADELDKLFITPEYNNVLPKRSLDKYLEAKADYEKKKKEGKLSFELIKDWTWQTVPYVYNWFWLSIIGYIVGFAIFAISLAK